MQAIMDMLNQRQSDQPRSTIWPGLLMGFLLTLFMAVLVYVVYLFLSTGRAALAGVPDLPPLALPRVVRAIPAADQPQLSQPLGVALQPSAGRAAAAAPVATDRVTVLIMGVDSRPDELVARTDTIMVLTFNPETGAAGMLSLPRDLVVHVSAVDRDVKINTVHVLGELNRYPGGGPALLRDTVAELIGYPIDYFVRVNFDGFEQIVDQIGGVDIHVLREIDDPLYPDENYGYDPLYIPAGLQHMDGELALKYARTRHIDSDYGRAERQQQVILAIKDKVTQPGQLAALLPRLPGLTLALANSVQTDMPVERAIGLARGLGDIDLQNPTRIVADNTMGSESMDPVLGFILTVDMARLRAATAAIFADNGVAPPTLTAQELAQERLASEAAQIVVLNGTIAEGLAARLAAALAADGFSVVAVGNADRVDYAESVLITNADRAPQTREALIERLGIDPANVSFGPPSDGPDFRLIVGLDQE